MNMQTSTDYYCSFYKSPSVCLSFGKTQFEALEPVNELKHFD